MSRRTLLAGTGVAGAIAVAFALVATGVVGGSSAKGEAPEDDASTALATVTRQTLSSQTQASATLGYARAAKIVAPAGTSPSALLQAEQAATSARATLTAAQVALAADLRALADARSRLAADRQKRALDCRGGNAAESPASGSSGGGSADACATDHQTVATDEQAVAGAVTKVAGDRQAVGSAGNALSGAAATLAAARSSATLGGESSAYTWLPGAGQVIERGQTLYRVSDQPVVLLYGPIAQWRAFIPGMSPGRDVAQLNANLRALGFGKGLAGSEFTAATESAIRAFQSAHGLTASGRLLLGAVVFKPGAVRVTSATPTVGAAVQPGPVLDITTTLRQVTIQLNASQQAGIEVGDKVTITLPDGRTTPGVVSSVGSVATASSDEQGPPQSPTIEVHVRPSDPAATGRLDQAPVTVSITTDSIENALVVPVDALLALAGGGYAVEEVTSAGAHRLIPVTIGMFDDAHGLVAVTGTGLAAGQRVVVPSS